MNYENMKKQNSSFICHRSSFRSGFTLMEILLVVVIILIATGISVPMFRSNFQSAQMRDAVRSTMRLARYARSLAIIRQVPCELTFEQTTITLSCGTGTNDPNAETMTRRLPEDIRITEFENRSEDDLSIDENRRVQFYVSGMNDGFELTLRDRNQRRTLITCDPYSGKLTVKETL